MQRVGHTFVSKGTIFLDFHYPYKGYFSAVIFASDAGNFKFSSASFYLNKEVRITGTIQVYQGDPEIIVRSPSQIEVAYIGFSYDDDPTTTIGAYTKRISFRSGFTRCDSVSGRCVRVQSLSAWNPQAPLFLNPWQSAQKRWAESTVEAFPSAIFLATEAACGRISVSSLDWDDHLRPLFAPKYWLIAACVVPTFFAASV